MSSRQNERIFSWREADGHKDDGLKRYMASISVPLTLKVMRWSQKKKCDSMTFRPTPKWQLQKSKLPDFSNPFTKNYRVSRNESHYPI